MDGTGVQRGVLIENENKKASFDNRITKCGLISLVVVQAGVSCLTMLDVMHDGVPDVVVGRDDGCVQQFILFRVLMTCLKHA